MNDVFIQRKITPRLEKLIKEKQVIIITGMRRVGKTTLLKYLYGQIQSNNKIFLDLEDVLTRKLFSETNYQNIKNFFEGENINFNKKSYIFIDEVQFAPQISSVMKYFYDRYHIKFVVTGSSSYYIKNHFTESLSGRKFTVELFPLTFKEFLLFKGIKKQFKLDFEQKILQGNEFFEAKYRKLYIEYMQFGGFPDVVLNDDKIFKKEILKDILNSYFQIDVTTLADFSDIAKLRDLLILLTQRIGQKINITNLANVLKIKRSKVYEYLEFLKSTYVINAISQKSSIDNKVSADSKLYFLDTGIANILADISLGSKLENSIYMNLTYDNDLSYYQTKSGGEIDFILDNKIGIEVKLTPSQQDLSILKKRAVSAKINKFFLVGLNYSKVSNTMMAWDL